MRGLAAERYCVEFAKSGPARFLSHLDLQEAIGRAMRRACLPLAFSQGYHPRPKLQFEEALPLGWTSECESLWFDLEQRYPTHEALVRLRRVAPAGIEFLRLYPAPGKPRPASERRFALELHESLPERLDSALSAAYPPAAGEPAVTAERCNGEWHVRIARDIDASAPSMKKVLRRVIGGEVPASLQVRRLALDAVDLERCAK